MTESAKGESDTQILSGPHRAEAGRERGREDAGGEPVVTGRPGSGGRNDEPVYRATWRHRAIGKTLWWVSLMKRLVEFPLDHGGNVVVEIDEPPAGPTMRGLGKDRSSIVEQADKTFEDATAAVTPAARSLIDRLRSIDNPPDEVGLEFGVALSAQTGAFIASVAGQANFKVSMTWRSQAANSESSSGS